MAIYKIVEHKDEEIQRRSVARKGRGGRGRMVSHGKQGRVGMMVPHKAATSSRHLWKEREKIDFKKRKKRKNKLKILMARNKTPQIVYSSHQLYDHSRANHHQNHVNSKSD